MDSCLNKVLEKLSIETHQLPSLSAMRFLRIYNDRSALTVSTDLRISDYLLSRKAPIAADVAGLLLEQNHYELVPKGGRHTQDQRYYREKFGVQSVINIFRKLPNCVDVLALYSRKSNERLATDTLNAKSSLDNVMFEIGKVVGSQPISKARIKLESCMIPDLNKEPSGIEGDPTPSGDDEKLADLLDGIFSRFPSKVFSEREVQCMKLMLLGLTSKEIADILKISYRTVEYYFNNIKLKTGLSNKSELRNYLIKFNPQKVLALA